MKDYRIINYYDNEYPEKLKLIANPPKNLYVKGNLELLDREMFAIIGTRKITDYGKKYAKIFAKEIALRNIPIISGMAIGTDSIAHQIALKYNCPTIAVLGTGIDKIYPKKNKELYYKILESNGLILSEVHPDTEYNSKYFPLRNRIVSGLSDGVLVIEAGYRSGTSITVKYAKQQGKLVFALPGRLDDKYSVDSNIFIKQGAKLVTKIDDILINYPQFMNKKRKSEDENNVKEEYIEIYNLIKEKNYSIEELLNKVKNKSIIEITNLLTMMEIDDLIVKDFGNGYMIKEKDA